MKIVTVMLCGMLLFVSSLTYSQKIYNAWSLSKALAQYSSNGDQTKLNELIGGVMWYTENNGDNISTVKDAQEYFTAHYPALANKFKDITGTLTSGWDLLELNNQQLQSAGLGDDVVKYIESLRIARKTANDAFIAKQLRINMLNNVRSAVLKKYGTRNPKLANDSVERIETLKSAVAAEMFEQQKISDSLYQVAADFKENLLTVEQKAIIKKIPLDKNLQPDAGQDNLTSMYSGNVKAVTEEFQQVRDNFSEPVSNQKINLLPGQSQLIDALAIYLAKRVKQEAVLWFFENLKTNSSQYELVKSCFPQTYDLLQDKETYETPNMGSRWRYAISSDFIRMPEHLLESDWMKRKQNNSNAPVFRGLNAAIKLARMVEQNYCFRDLITQLYTEIPESEKASHVASLNTLICLLFALNNECYKYNDKEILRLQLSDFQHMTNEEFKIMIALIDVKYDHIFRTLVFDNEKIDDLTTAEINSIRKWFGGLNLKIQQLESRAKALTESANSLTQNAGEPSFQFSNNTTWKFYQDLLDGLTYHDTSSVRLFTNFNNRLDTIIRSMANVQDFFQMLEKKNFAGSVKMLLNLMGQLTKSVESNKFTAADFTAKLQETRLKFYKDIPGNFKNEDLQKRFEYTYDPVSETVTVGPGSMLQYALESHDQQALALINKLAGFLNDLTLTKSSHDLSRVIESYAMPPGSYKLKRSSWLSLDLNAYVGVYGGYEWTQQKGNMPKTSGRTGPVYGITAPIGFSISKTFGKKMGADQFHSLGEEYLHHPENVKFGIENCRIRTHTTVSAFFSIIDLGAVVSYRFNSDTAVLPQKLKWEQLFSPGVHLNIGIKGTPLVFAAGYSYTPSLRRLAAVETKQYNANRVFAGVLFDIPLYNLSAATERNKFIRTH